MSKGNQQRDGTMTPAEAEYQPKGSTPLRAVRVPDEIWKPAKEIAAREGETLSEVIRRALVEYAAKN